MRRGLTFAASLAWLLTTSLVFDACEPRGGGKLEARWTGADTGRLVTPAAAEWCAAGKYVEIQATQGDTGLAVALFPADTSLPGRYTLIEAAVDSNRPTAAVALRWSNPTSITGFRSDSGTVVLRRAMDGSLAGEFKASGRVFVGERFPLHITGSFRDLTVRPAAGNCPVLLLQSRDTHDIRNARDTSVYFPRANDLLPKGIRPQGRSGGAAH